MGNINNDFSLASDFESIKLNISSIISNDEFGTYVFFNPITNYEDGYEEEEEKILKINSSFIFTVLDEQNVINKIGIFIG